MRLFQMPNRSVPNTKKARRKVGIVLHEFKRHNLHSGKGGSIVTNPKQALAIAISEARRHAH